MTNICLLKMRRPSVFQLGRASRFTTDIYPMREFGQTMTAYVSSQGSKTNAASLDGVLAPSVIYLFCRSFFDSPTSSVLEYGYTHLFQFNLTFRWRRSMTVSISLSCISSPLSTSSSMWRVKVRLINESHAIGSNEPTFFHMPASC